MGVRGPIVGVGVPLKSPIVEMRVSVWGGGPFKGVPFGGVGVTSRGSHCGWGSRYEEGLSVGVPLWGGVSLLEWGVP